MPYKYNPLTKKLDYYEAGAESLTLDNINDVNVGGATQDQVLAYNASSGTWTPATISSSVSALDDLSDVSTAGASQDQVLSYNPSTGSWSPTTIDGSGGAITTDTTYYVDGDSGDDSNDGSSWANAKKTFDFLYSGSSSAISREIRAAVTINVRGTVLSAGTERHFHADDFYGNGTITIVGETQNEVTGLTPTGYNNTVSDQRYHQYIEVSGAGWTPNDYKGMFIQFTSPASDTLYPIIENTADTLETTALPDLAGTETFKIVSITSKFKSAEVADPGTPLLYGYWHFFNIENNTIPFRFQKLDIDSEAPTVKSYLFTSYGAAGNFDDSLWTYGGFYVENCMIGGLWHRTPDFVNVRRCYCNLEDYSGIFLDRRGYLYQSVVVSDAGTGNGIIVQTGGAINVEQSRITEQRVGLFVNAQGHLTVRSSELKDNGTAVIVSHGSVVVCDTDLSGPLSFIDNTKAIVRSRGGSLFLDYNENYYYSGNTYDIQWNHDPDLMISFSDYFAGVKVEDMSIRGPNGNPSYIPDSINNDMTFYVDGSTGSDTATGQSWSTAKKTFSFLYSGGTHALPREINSTITIYCRNTIYMHEANKSIYIDNMHGSGQIVIEGVPTTIASAITPTGWDNTKSSQTYRTYVEASGESWTPEEHVSRFIERTSATGTYYPIIENTATRLEGVAIPITNGSHTFNIVEMPLLAGALVTDTGTPIISLTDNQIDLYKSSIDVSISNLNAFNADGSVSSIDIDRYSGNAEFYSVFSRVAIFQQSSGEMYLRRCGIYDDSSYAAGWYTTWSNGNPFLRDCALRGPDDGTGWGLYWSQGLNGYTRVYNVRVKDYDNGMYSEIASSLINLDGINLIEGATIGLGLEASTVELGLYSTPTDYLHFLNCTTGISLQAGKIKKEESVEFTGSGVTTEILLANSPADVTDTFANANAEAAIYNAATGAGILYYNPSTMTFTVPSDYDNSSSGLSANTLQDAVDEIAGYTAAASEIDHNGFINRTDSEYSFDDGNLRFSIGPKAPATEFSYYSEGTKYTKTGTETVDITDTSGLWYIYYDGSTLTSTQTWSDDLILKYALVAFVNWSTTDSEANFIADERHGISMAPATHEHLHETIGTVWYSGLGLTNILSDESGDLDTHAQLGYGSGEIADEDNIFEIAVGTAPAQIPMFYRHGASGEWRRQTANNFPVINYSGGDNMLAWNENNGGTWQQTEVDDADLVLTHIFATNDIDQPIIGIQGQAEYNNLNQARQGALTELTNLALNGLPTAEFKAIATVIFQTDRTAYANAVKARIRTTDEGGDYLDWRTSTAVASNTGFVSDHGSLSGLSDDDHAQYALINGTRAFTGTVGGIDPVSSSDLATKNYVDTYGAGVPIEDTDVDSGTDELLDSFSASSYDACFWEYVLWNTNSGTSKRAGVVTATWDEVGGTVEFFDSSTNDIGDTSDAVLSVTYNVSTGEIQLVATMSTDNWTVKTKRRTL